MLTDPVCLPDKTSFFQIEPNKDRRRRDSKQNSVSNIIKQILFPAEILLCSIQAAPVFLQLFPFQEAHIFLRKNPFRMRCSSGPGNISTVDRRKTSAFLKRHSRYDFTTETRFSLKKHTRFMVTPVCSPCAAPNLEFSSLVTMWYTQSDGIFFTQLSVQERHKQH